MILSDGALRMMMASRDLVIRPQPADHQIQPASIDITLSDRFLVPEATSATLDPLNLPDDLMRPCRLGGSRFRLERGRFVLGCSEQSIKLPDHVVARVEGCSSLGRLGLLVHCTAGFVDPGWPLGQITLELANVGPWDLWLTPGMKIAQLSFEYTDTHVQRPYGHSGLGSHYVGQAGPVASRMSGA